MDGVAFMSITECIFCNVCVTAIKINGNTNRYDVKVL